MSGPIVFISHSRVKDGGADGLRAFLAAGSPTLEVAKPRTLAFLPYLNEDAAKLSIVHLFADSESFALHLEGVAERSAAADEFIETLGFEIYGQPSDAVVRAMRDGAAQSGASFTLVPDAIAGFLRAVPG